MTNLSGFGVQIMPNGRKTFTDEAFIPSDEATRRAYAKAYADTNPLYYGDQPSFDQSLKKIAAWSGQL